MTKSDVQLILGIILVAVIGLSIAVGGFWLKRTVNYNLYYKKQVEEHVNQLVEKKFNEELPSRIEAILLKIESEK